MSKILVDIPYLELEDVTSDGNLSYVNGKPSLVMLQGNFCPHCNVMKPAYQEVFNQVQGQVNIYTIQIDGKSKSDKEAGALLMNKHGVHGVPAVLRFDKNGKFKDRYNGERTVAGLKPFALELA
jgi:thiol-disulfide isomerase/thioredoxin